MAENERFETPRIKQFAIYPEETESDDLISTAIIWDVENAEKAWFEDAPDERLSLAGTKTVLVRAPKVFRLFAQNGDKTVSVAKTLKKKKKESAKVKVLKFFFDKSEIFAGEKARLKWETDANGEFEIEVFPNYLRLPKKKYQKNGYLDLFFSSPGLNDPDVAEENRFFYFFKIKSSNGEILSTAKIKVFPHEFKKSETSASNDLARTEDDALIIRTFKRFLDSDVIKDQAIFSEESVFSKSSLRHLHCDAKRIEKEKNLYFVLAFDDNPCLSETAAPQFSIVYGHKHGSGSFSDDPRDLHSKTAYSQWKNLLLNSNADFEFKNGEKSDAICVIALSRKNGYVHFSPGKWMMPVGEGTSAKILIDDSEFPSETIRGTTSKAHHVVEGTFDAARQRWIPKSDSRGYGLAFPDKGVWVLNLKALREDVPIFNRCQDWSFGNGARNNNVILFNILHECFSNSSMGFVANREITILCDHYMATLKADEFNFTNNKTYWVQSSDGSFELRHETMRENSTTFITTIGLYNDKRELIAIGKLNKPLKKNWDKEITITLRLDKR